METADLDRMRAAFVLAAAWHGWSEEDQADIGASIREAIEAGDEQVLLLWQTWLDGMAGLPVLAAGCRAAEEHIKGRKSA